MTAAVTTADLKRVREEVADLRAEIDHIKSALMPPTPRVSIPVVSPQQLALLSLLASRPAASRDSLCVVMNPNDVELGRKAFDVQMCRLRRVMRAYGVAIPYRGSDGLYSMAAVDREATTAWLTGQRPVPELDPKTVRALVSRAWSASGSKGSPMGGPTSNSARTQPKTARATAPWATPWR